MSGFPRAFLLPLILVLFLILVTTAPKTQHAQSCASPPSGMVGWWPGDGNASDIQGSNNGTLQNGATFAQGFIGQAFNLDGVDDYVNIPDNDHLEVNSQFTLEAWIRPAFDTGDNHRIISKFGSIGNYAYQMGVAPNGGLISEISGNGTTFDSLSSPPLLLTRGQWAHVATTFNGGSWKLYVNGVEVASKTSQVTSIFSGGATDLSIGRDPVGYQYFAGLIDEAGIYNRALAASEIQSIYNVGSAGKCKPQAGIYAYVANFDANTVSVIEAASNTVTATVPVGSGPIELAVTPDGSRVYVANEFSGNVSVIDTATNTVTATIRVGDTPQRVAVTPDGSRAYVTNASSNNVSVINTTTNTVVTSIPVDNKPFGAAISPDGTRLYVANDTSGTISVIQIATNSVVATVPVGNRNLQLAITPDGSRAYVANFGTSPTVSVIDLTTNSIVATINVGSGPNSAIDVAITPDGSRAYVANYSSDTVTVINTATNTVTATIPVGDQPEGLAITPDGTRVYVVNSLSNSVSIIATANNMVVTTVPLGEHPFGIAIKPLQQTPICVPPPSGMVSWWPGDGNTNDILGGNNGTLQNGATFAPGMVGQAFSFDGVNGYVEIPNSPTLNTPTAITLDAWVKPSTIGTHIIASKYDSSATGGGASWALLDNGTGRLRFEADGQGSSSRDLDTNSPVLTVGVWQHVAATFDVATQEMKIYVNGVEVPSTLTGSGAVTSIFNSTAPVRIGAYLDGSGRFNSWNGLIDEVSLYNRALTASEIQAIYNAGSAGKCKSQQTFVDDFNRPDGAVGNGWSNWWCGQFNSYNVSLSGGELTTQGCPNLAGGIYRTLPISFPAAFSFDFRTLDSDGGGWQIAFNTAPVTSLPPPSGTNSQLMFYQYSGSGPVTRGYLSGGVMVQESAQASGQRNYRDSTRARVSGVVNADLSSTITVHYNDGLAPDPVTFSFGPAVNPSNTQPGSVLVLGNSSAFTGPHIFDNLVIGPPLPLSSLSLTPSTVAGGQSSTGTVTLQNPAPPGGATVSLSGSNKAAATVPESITIPQGSSSGAFTVTTNAVTSDTPVTITASYFGATTTATLMVTAPRADLQISSLSSPAQSLTDISFNVSWVDTNNGQARATGPWTDKVYLSTDNQLGNDTLLAQLAFSGSLDPGQSTPARVQSISIPRSAIPTDGQYFLIVLTDADNNVTESDESNNWRAVPITVTTTPPVGITVSPGDLQFGAVPITTSARRTVTITSTGQNPLTVNSINIAGTFFTLGNLPSLPLVLAPASTASFDVIYTPLGTITSTGTVTINSNATTAAPPITLSGNGTPPPLPPAAAITVATDQPVYRRGQPVQISGKVSSADGTGISNVPVAVQVTLNGSVRTFNPYTDAQGTYRTIFQPAATDGGAFTVTAAGTSGGATKQAGASFRIAGLLVSPDSLSQDLVMGGDLNVPLDLQNVGDAPLNNLSYSVVITPAGALTAKLPQPASSLVPGSPVTVPVVLTAPSGNPPPMPVSVQVKVTASDSVGGLVDQEISSLTITLRPAVSTPVLIPSSLSVGVNPGKSITRRFVVRNDGYLPMNDATVTLQNPTDFNWVSLGNANLGTIAPGDSREFQVMISPPADLKLGDYTVLFNVNGGTSPLQGTINISVTQSTLGTASFVVSDDTGSKVGGATVTLFGKTNGKTFQGVTGGDGVASIGGVNAGEYSYVVAAASHDPGSGPVTVAADSTVSVPVLLSYEVVSLTFTVTPTTIVDQYNVTLNITYSTTLPKPALQVVPYSIDLSFFPEEVQDGKYPCSLSITNTHPTAGVRNVTVDASQLDVSQPDGQRVHVQFADGTAVYEAGSLAGKATTEVPCYATLDGGEVPTHAAGSILVQANYDFSLDGQVMEGTTVTKVPVNYVRPDELSYQPIPFIYDKRTDPANPVLKYDAGSFVYTVGSNRNQTFNLLKPPGPLFNGHNLVAFTDTQGGASNLDVINANQANVFWRTDFSSIKQSLLGSGDTTTYDISTLDNGLTLAQALNAQIAINPDQALTKPTYLGFEGQWADSLSPNGYLVPVKVTTITPNGISIPKPPQSPVAGCLNPEDPICKDPEPQPVPLPSQDGQILLGIDQTIRLERQAFNASLGIGAHAVINNTVASISVRDASGNDASNNFFVLVTADPLGATRGGTVSGQTNVSWQLIPKADAGGTSPQGAQYKVQAGLSYVINGTARSAKTQAVTITVLPSPKLKVSYSAPFVVMAGKEANVRVSVQNVGSGMAHNLSIESMQPRIVATIPADPIDQILDNPGPLVDFNITGSSNTADGTGFQDGNLMINFGDVPPGATVSGYWALQVSRNGFFIDISSSFSHRDFQGIQLDPLVLPPTTSLVPAIGGTVATDSGQGIPGLTVSVSQAGVVKGSDQTDFSGVYYISDLTPGDYLEEVRDLSGAVLASKNITVLGDQATNFINFVIANYNPTLAIVAIKSDPPGLSFTADGVAFVTPHSFTWDVGSTHTIEASGTAPSDQLLVGWSDGESSASRTITVDAFGGNFQPIYMPADVVNQYTRTPLSLDAPGSNTSAPVTTGQTDHKWPSMNNHGDIVWSQMVNDHWQVFRKLSTGAPEQITSDNHNHERPVISDDGTIAWFQDSTTGGLGYAIMRLDPGSSNPSLVEFSSRNSGSCNVLPCTPPQERAAGKTFGIDSGGRTISFYTYYEFGYPIYRRFNVSGIGKLPEGSTSPGDLSGYESPDINRESRIVYSDGFVAGVTAKTRHVWLASTTQPLNRTHIDEGQYPHISDGDNPEIAYVKNGIEVTHWPGAGSGRWVDTGLWADVTGTGADAKIIYERKVNGYSQIFIAKPKEKEADLAITETAPPRVESGSSITYALTVTNNGPSQAESVTVTDPLPVETTFVSCSSAEGGVCGGSGNNQVVTFDSIPSGLSETITIVATVNNSVPVDVKISNTATIDSTTRDPDLNNNSATAETVTTKLPSITSVTRQFPSNFFLQFPSNFFQASDFTNRFDVTVDWKGLNPGTVSFSINNKPPVIEQAVGPVAFHTFDMAKDFQPNTSPSTITMIAVNKQGAQSEPFVNHIYVLPWPLWLNIETSINDFAFSQTVGAGEVTYNLKARFPRKNLEGIIRFPDNIPYIGGRWGLQNTGATFDGKVSTSGISKIKLGGQYDIKMADQSFTGKASGGGTFTFNEGGLKVKEVSFNLDEASGEFKKKANLLDAVPPLRVLTKTPVIGGALNRFLNMAELEGTATPKVNGALSFQQDPFGDLVFNEGTFGGDLTLKGTLNVNFTKHLTASAWVAGSEGIEFGVPAGANPIRKASATVEVGASIKISYLFDIKQEGKWVYKCNWDPTLGFKCSQGGDSSLAGGSASLNSFKFNSPKKGGGSFGTVSTIAPNYTIFGQYAAFHPGSLTKDSNTPIQSSVQEATIVSNIFPGAAPVMAEVGGGRLLLWAHQDRALPVLQSTDIYWSYNDGSGWSTPAPIHHDTQCELSPVVGVDASGKVVAAWTRIKDPNFSASIQATADLPLFYNRLEVVSAIFDPASQTWGPITQLTDDAALDTSLTLSSDATGRLLLTWLSNPFGEFLSTATSPSTLKYSFWNGSKWNDPEVIASNLVGVSSHVAALHASSAFVITPRITDLNGTGGSVLDLYKWNGSGWSAASTFAAGGVDNDTPTAAYDTAGEGHVVWVRDTDLVHATLSDQTPQTIRPDSASAAFHSAQLLTNAQGRLTLLWQEATDAGPANIYAKFYDPVSNTWSLDRQINLDDTHIAHDVSGYYGGDGTLHLTYLSTEVLRSNETVTIDGEPVIIPNIPHDGQTDLRVLDHVLSVDLAVTDSDLNLSPQTPQTGDLVTVTLDVHNAGDLAVNNFAINLYSGDPSSGGNLIGTAAVKDPIVAGDHRVVTFPVFNMPVGGGNITAVVDANNSVQEVNESNNRATSYLNNAAPQARAVANITSGASPLTINFDGSSSTDAEGDTLSYLWTFGDGSQGASGAQVTHTFAQAGSYPVMLSVTDSHGAVGTATITILVNESSSNPVPTLSGLAPDSIAAAGPQLTLTAGGTNFVNGSLLEWNGSPRPTVFVSPTQLTATIPASDIALEGTASVTIVNPAPGGGTSNALPFIIHGAVCVGDLNFDGVTDTADLEITKSAFGSRCGTPEYKAVADVNHDCVVDVNDLAIVSRDLGCRWTPPHFSITGRAADITGTPIGNVTMTLSGSQSATTQTDSNGNYSFANLLNGNYTVTPSLTGFTFTPANLSFPNLGSNQMANFTGVQSTFSVGGKVIFGNVGLGGVTITVGGSQSRTVTTDSGGNYLITNLPTVGNYTITPSKTNYDFTPQNQTLNNQSGDQTANFTATVTPGVPILVSEENSTRAVALDSVLWLPGPFQLNYSSLWGVDRRTRVTLFAMNFDLQPGENVSSVTADAEDASHHIYPLTVEYVGKVAGFDWLRYVVVRLNDDMGDTGDVLVRVNVHGKSSNRVRLGVGHVGGGPPDDPWSVPTPGRQP
jgi:uncharacterized repeat protein (TIGR01451 family)